MVDHANFVYCCLFRYPMRIHTHTNTYKYGQIYLNNAIFLPQSHLNSTDVVRNTPLYHRPFFLLFNSLFTTNTWTHHGHIHLGSKPKTFTISKWHKIDDIFEKFSLCFFTSYILSLLPIFCHFRIKLLLLALKCGFIVSGRFWFGFHPMQNNRK